MIKKQMTDILFFKVSHNEGCCNKISYMFSFFSSVKMRSIATKLSKTLLLASPLAQVMFSK